MNPNIEIKHGAHLTAETKNIVKISIHSKKKVKNMTVDTIDTCAATLYAIMDKDGCLLTIKNRTLHSTRIDARKYRRLTNKKNVRIVKGDFTNYTDWITAK